MTKKRARKEKLKRRKNFLPTLILTTILWITLISLIFLTPPDSLKNVVLFFTVFFLTLLFTFSIILNSTRRGLVFSFLALFFFVLRAIGVGNILNLLLLAGLGVSIEVYFSKN